MLLRFAPHLLDAVAEHNYTPLPLMVAVQFYNRDAMNMLLRAGADVRAKDDDYRTVFDYARYNEEILEILKQHQHVSGIF